MTQRPCPTFKRITRVGIAFIAVMLATPAQAYKVLLSPGAASNTTQATDKTLWPYSAANVDGGKFGGTWSNNVYTPSSDRQKIADNYTNKTAQIEDVVYNYDNLDASGNPIPPPWLVNHTLPGNYSVTASLGQNVLFSNLYNANGQSWNTAGVVNDINFSFTNSGVNNANIGTIIRNAGGGYTSFLQPYGHFLFEIRTDTVLQNSSLQDAVINTTKWGLDNGKDVFLQILPQNGSRDFEFDMRAVMQILYTRLGATRFQSTKLWISVASYDGSEYNTRFAPEIFNGDNHYNTLTGVAKTLLENRSAWQAGNFSQSRSSYTVEAESASGQSAFSPYTTVTESGVTYISWPGSGLSNSGYPGTADGRALYTFNVSAAGTVALEANVNLADSNSDSFWYKIDDLPWQMEIDESGGGLIWIGLGRYALKAGDHTLEVVRRRPNAKIDKFRFASLTTTVAATAPKSATASAGLEQVVYDYDANGTEPVTLDASGSKVTTGTITSYIWKKDTTQIATGVRPSVNLAVGTHAITLTVTGSAGSTDTANSQMIVRSNDGKVVVENNTEDVLDTSAFGETHYITNFRVAKGDGRKLVVTVGSNNIGTLALKYAGRPLTLAKRQDNGTSHASIWYLDNPPVGAADVIQTGGAARGSSLGVLSLQNAAPGAFFTAGISDRKITYTVPVANTLIVGSYSDSYENAGPSAPQTNKFVTSGGWGGSALAGWQNITSAGSRTDTYRVSTTKPVAISTVGFVAASPKAIEAESAVGQPNLPPFIQQTDPDGTSYLVVPNGTASVNMSSVTELTGIAAYNFNLTAPADVVVEARVFFTDSNSDSFWHRVDSGAWIKQEGPVFAGWNWITLGTYPALSAGSHNFSIVRREAGMKIDNIRFTPSSGTLAFVAPPPVYATFGNGGIPGTGEPWLISDALPTRIEAENYNQGGQGASYNDTTPGNSGGTYRTEDVDIQATTDMGGGYNVGFVATGEWLQYTVNVARSTYYRLNLRVSRQTTGTGLVRVLSNGVDKTGSLVVPNTGDWNSYVNLQVNVKLDAGQQVIRIEMLSTNFNLNYIELTPQNLPSPWQHQDIGTVAATGDAIYNSGTFTVFGSGSDIFGQSDKFHDAWRPATGNCELIARVSAMDNTNSGAKAGVMIRETLDSNSRHFSIFVTPGQGIIYSQRTTTGGFTATTTVASLTAPYWLKIKRAGSLFTGSYSADGVTWTVLGSQSLAISPTTYIGLAVTSKNDGTLCAATFDNVTTTANSAPTISDIDARSIAVNTNTGTIAFDVDDLETTAGSLTVTAISSNTSLVPNANIILGGSGANRTVSVTPAANQVGTATITLTVSDGSLSSQSAFLLTVSAPNTAPTIGAIANQAVNQDNATATLPFTVGAAETAAGSLTVTAASSNTTLVPNANVVLGGTGADRTVTVTPAAGQNGSTTITLTVNDGSLTATSSFVLAVNAPPTISSIANVVINEDTATAAIPFTIGDIDNDVASLTLTGSSSDTGLVTNEKIIFGGSGANRTVTVTPAADWSGTATITVTVNDGMQTAATTFLLTVNPTYDDWIKAATGTVLNTGTAWSGNVVPISPDTATWNATSLTGSLTLGANLNWAGIIVTNPAGAITIDGPNTLTLGISGINLSNATADLTLNHPIAMTGAQPWSVGAGRVLTANGIVSGSGTLTKSGMGIVTLGGANTFSGTVTVTSGPLRIRNSNSLGTNSKTIGLSNGSSGQCQLLLDGSGGPIALPAALTLSTSMASLTGAIVNEAGNNSIAGPINMIAGGGNTLVTVQAGSLALNGAITANASSGRVLVLAGTGSNAVSGAIKNGSTTASVTVQGGTWNLSAANTYTGSTTVSGGTLKLTGSLTSPVTVTGGVLNGTGTVAGNITLDGGTHAPGNSAGVMNLSGNYALNSGSTLQVEINGAVFGTQYDQVKLTGSSGTVTLGGALDIIAPPGLAVGMTFTIIDNTGPAAVSGIFAGKPQGSAFTASGYAWAISYTGGNGNNTTLTVVTAQDAWRFAYFGTTTNTGTAADTFDANNDGEINLLEFATGQNPKASTITSTPLAAPGENLEFTYPRSKAAMADGVIFAVQWSDTMAADSWSGSGVSEEILSDNGTVQTVRATLSAGSSGKRFVHLLVTH